MHNSGSFSARPFMLCSPISPGLSVVALRKARLAEKDQQKFHTRCDPALVDIRVASSKYALASLRRVKSGTARSTKVQSIEPISSRECGRFECMRSRGSSCPHACADP
eukprot:6189821-Pleurochrysis_carterae.AAC.1